MLNENEYNSLLNDIFARVPSVRDAGFSSGAYKPGLERMLAFDKVLGSPSKAVKSIHIAGTNGKGSVASMITAALASAGLKVGLYTSPHLQDFRERARIVSPAGCVFIDKEYVYDFLTRWKDWIDDNRLSFFEITTGMAFRWFADENVGAAVIETGLGGRLDSTNIVNPELSVITSIGLDHCTLLGGTRALIAAEKGGIMKDGVPCLAGTTDEETAPVLREMAWMKCPLSFADAMEPSLWYRHAAILSGMDLKGECQKENLRTTLAALDILSPRAGFESLSGKGEEMVRGIMETARITKFHCRWEQLSSSPRIICDIAHNPPALDINFRQLQRELAEGKASSLVIVFGVMGDKDVDGIIALMPREATYVLTKADTPRALAAEELLEKFKAGGMDAGRCYLAPTVRQAVETAVGIARRFGCDAEPGPLVYIGGSAFVAAEALTCFGKHSF
ncbi:MAG: bifunctional folylpolyglutamate synthase/dihydrofolate synthase [Bacteroidales bacterium]|nr:bifunctional folylpolyglutamate synthase/dihydrofolate synthase [Bacteroidales bacterium]